MLHTSMYWAQCTLVTSVSPKYVTKSLSIKMLKAGEAVKGSISSTAWHE